MRGVLPEVLARSLRGGDTDGRGMESLPRGYNQNLKMGEGFWTRLRLRHGSFGEGTTVPQGGHRGPSVGKSAQGALLSSAWSATSEYSTW